MRMTVAIGRWVAALGAAVSVAALAALASASAGIGGAVDAVVEDTSVENATITDVVLTVGADHTQRNVAWYTQAEGDGEVQWTRASAVGGDDFPEDEAESAAATETGPTHDGRNFHHATMASLQPATDYVYRVGSDGAWSDSYEFSTGDVETDGFSFAVVGDPQLGASGDLDADRDGWVATLGAALETTPEAAFVVSLGDQVQDAGDEDQYRALLSPAALRSVPFSFSLGNHDVDSTAHATHFFTPGTSDSHGVAAEDGQSGGNFWFTYGDVLVMGLNSNVLDVASHDAFMSDVIAGHGTDSRWLVTTFHHTAFGVAKHSNEADLVDFRGAIAPVLSEHDVDLALMGHDHTYARTHLMDGREPVPTDNPGELRPKDGHVLYLTLNSASGSKYYPILDDEALDAADRHGFDYAQVTWQDEAPTFTRVDVTADAMTIATHRTDSGEAIDELVLHHARADAAVPSPSETAPGDQNAASASPSSDPAATDNADNADNADSGLGAGAAAAVAAGAAALAGGAVVMWRRRS